MASIICTSVTGKVTPNHSYYERSLDNITTEKYIGKKEFVFTVNMEFVSNGDFSDYEHDLKKLGEKISWLLMKHNDQIELL